MLDTICALATAPVSGAVGIIRISGSNAVRAADRVFFPTNGKPMSAQKTRRMVYGEIRLNGVLLDIALAVKMTAPYSYTGEDIVELQCHGALAVLNAVLEVLWNSGTRPAKPGEFTQRAFLHGRLDLSQSEAVLDLIQAESTEAAKNAAAQLTGAIGKRFDLMYNTIADMLAHFHAVIDYPEEDIPEKQVASMVEDLQRIRPVMKDLLDTYERGKVIKDGIRCAILGKPNAGKSSLMNALAGYDRAIVTATPGTTRDTIEERITLGSFLLRLIDCAGIRDTDDDIERMGVERSREAARQAALLIVVLDGSQKLDSNDREILDIATGRPVIVVINKSDLPQQIENDILEAAFTHICRMSAKNGEGISSFESLLRRIFDTQSLTCGTALSNARQFDAITRAYDAVTIAHDALLSGVTPDAVLSELELALTALKELTGRYITQDVLERIFKNFCVGK